MNTNTLEPDVKKSIIDPIFNIAIRQPNVVAIWIIGTTTKGVCKLKSCEAALQYVQGSLRPSIIRLKIIRERLTIYLETYETTTCIMCVETNQTEEWSDEAYAIAKNAHTQKQLQSKESIQITNKIRDELIKIIAREVGPVAEDLYQDACASYGISETDYLEIAQFQAFVDYINYINQNTKRNVLSHLRNTAKENL